MLGYPRLVTFFKLFEKRGVDLIGLGGLFVPEWVVDLSGIRRWFMENPIRAHYEAVWGWGGALH